MEEFDNTLINRKCSYCENDAIKGSYSPYAAELFDDYSLRYFVCSDLKCLRKFEDDLYQSRMDV